MNAENYVVRSMTQSEVADALRQAGEEGWNPGIHDAECFYRADPNGFLIGLLDGEPVSCISAVSYGSSYAFIGLYIVKPAYRHHGLGPRIADEALSRVASRDIGLDGVLEREESYKRQGFVSYYHNTRYEGRAAGIRSTMPHPCVIPLSSVEFEDLVAYDTALFSAPRPEFLDCWIDQPDSVALGFVDGHLRGYTVLRKCLVGYKFGPLFADTETIAEILFQQAGGCVAGGTPIFLDVPGETQNPAATALAKRHGMQPVFATARMYRTRSGAPLGLQLERCFGVTTFELG